MYETKYTDASGKFSVQAQRKLQRRQRGRSCGYYMRVAFFFTSLIQSLIIVGLVLFLIYGKPQDSASESRIKDLDKSFSQLSLENLALKQDKKNLTKQLNVTATQRIVDSKELSTLRSLAANSLHFLKSLNSMLMECKVELSKPKTAVNPCPPPINSRLAIPNSNDNKLDQLGKTLALEKANFTQIVQMLKIDMEQLAKERDNLHLDAIALRRDKLSLERTLSSYTRKCKEDFAQSLSGITDVSRAFLEKIERLFPHHISFQLTCEKQRDNLEQIRTNCTSLSRQVENRFQQYLERVGADVSHIHGQNSRLEADNQNLREQERWCSQNRTGMIWEHKQNMKKLQEKHDNEKEKILKEKLRMRGEKDLLESQLQVKEADINTLNDKIRTLNASKANCGQFLGGTNPFSTSRTNMGSNPAFGRTGTGTSSMGSSVGSNGFGLGSTGQSGPGLGAGRVPGSTGLVPGSGGLGTGVASGPAVGTSSMGTGLGSAGRTGSVGTGIGGIGPGPSGGGTGTGSIGSGTRGAGVSGAFGNTGTGTSKGVGNKPTGGAGFGTGSSAGTGLGSNPFGGGGAGNRGTTGTGFSTGGSAGPGLGSSPFGGVGLGNRGIGGGTTMGGTGSSFSVGTGGASLLNIDKHLQELQRYSNPPGSTTSG